MFQEEMMVEFQLFQQYVLLEVAEEVLTQVPVLPREQEILVDQVEPQVVGLLVQVVLEQVILLQSVLLKDKMEQQLLHLQITQAAVAVELLGLDFLVVLVDSVVVE